MYTWIQWLQCHSQLRLQILCTTCKNDYIHFMLKQNMYTVTAVSLTAKSADSRSMQCTGIMIIFYLKCPPKYMEKPAS